jgi:hypothetical protein
MQPCLVETMTCCTLRLSVFSRGWLTPVRIQGLTLVEALPQTNVVAGHKLVKFGQAGVRSRNRTMCRVMPAGMYFTAAENTTAM